MTARRRSLLLSSEGSVPYCSAEMEEAPSSLRSQGAVCSKVAAMREGWDERVQNRTLAAADLQHAKESPTLTQLRMPSEGSTQEAKGSVYARQRTLEKLHHDAKSRLESMSGVCGGVSLWPAMDDMRLSRSDAVQLSCLSLSLMAATGILFAMYHGAHVTKLKHYSNVLREFASTHPLCVDGNQEVFDAQVLHWHTELLAVQSAVHSDFDVVWSEASTFDIFLTLLYIGGIVMLLYFLAENVFSKNRLTPRRIKLWVCLLCVMTLWSVFSLHLLVTAQKLEAAMEGAVLSLSDQLARLVLTDLDLNRYHDVLIYWRTRYLQPTSQSLLSVLGLVAVKDMSFYLHYYSLPILTALCTPIIKLAISIKTVYQL